MRPVLLGAAGIAAIVIIVGGVVVALQSGSTSHAATSSGDGSGGGGTSTTLPALAVTAISPAAATQNVDVAAPIQVTFNQALSPRSPTPTINPPVSGTWAISGETMTFHPTGGYLPYTTYQVTVPTSTESATVHKSHVDLAAAYQSTFKVQDGSQLRVEQMLAELNYLPLQFVASPPTPAATPSTSAAGDTTSTAAGSSTTAAGATSTSSSSSTAAGATTSSSSTTPTTAAAPAATAASTLAAESTNQSAVDTAPEPGTFSWRWANTPSTLTSLWTPGTQSVIDQGAIMAFENANGMKMDGLAGPDVWAALVKAVATRAVTPQPYYYLVASKVEPETLTVYENGASIYSSLANTGVADAPTPNGTWPVYDRAAVTTMTGTNPDGSTYNDPGIPWVAYFHGGDAVHGFIRGSYGVPQSVGCVELPEANAAVVWKDDPYGTLVTVTG